MNRGRSKGGSFTSFTSLTSLTSFTSFHNRISFNFHQHFRRNQLAHFHHARRWPDLSEKFSMRPPHLFPLRDVRHIDARPHYVFQTRAGFGERRLDVLDGLHRLRAQIAHANDLSVWPRRRRSRNGNDVADPHRARIPHNRLPRCPARYVLSCHAWSPRLRNHTKNNLLSICWDVRKWLVPVSRGTSREDA